MKKSIDTKLTDALSELIAYIANEAINIAIEETIDAFIIDASIIDGVFSHMGIYDTIDFDNEIYKRAKEMFPDTNFESEYENENDSIFGKKQAD